MKKILIILVAFILLEFSIRIFLPEYKYFSWVNNYTPKIEAKEGYKILCLGDSITLGAFNNIQDSYPEVLKKLMKCEIINPGSLEYPHLELEYLKNKGIQFKPNLVIVEICLNDVGNSYYKLNNNNHKSLLSRLRWMIRRSCLFSFLDVKITEILYKTGIKKYDCNSYEEQLLCFGINQNSEKGWDLLFKDLLEFRDYLLKRKIEFIVVVFPYEFQNGNNFFNIDKSKFTINPQEKLLEFGHKNNITILDLLPYFKGNIYFPMDYVHPNKRGLKIASEQIYKILKQRKDRL